MRLSVALQNGAARKLGRHLVCLKTAQLRTLQVHALPWRQVPYQCSPLSTPDRGLTTTPPLLKKSPNPPNIPTEFAGDTPADPHDLSVLEALISHVHEKLDDDLAKLRPGGRLRAEDIEGLPVHLPVPKERKKDIVEKMRGPIKGVKDTVRLADVAQVVPRGGRGMIIMVGEKDHVKSVQSAILSSLQPLMPATSASGTSSNANPDNPLELHYTIPPPTMDSRNAVLTTATYVGSSAADRIHKGRAAQQKRLRSMELGHTGVKVQVDSVRKGRTKMENLVKKGEDEVAKMVDAARKRLEGG